MVFSQRPCQNRGVIRRVNSSDTGAASCPGRPAVEHASRKGFLSGGRATPTKGCNAKGCGTPQGWVFLVYNPTSKWQSCASHVVQGGRACSPSWPQICSNSLASAAQVLRLQVWVIMPRLDKLQIKQTIFLQNYSLKAFFYPFTYLLENIKLNLWFVL